MTGYGKAATNAGDKKITLEIRSLNGKQADLTLRLPPCYRSLEVELRRKLSAGIQRGKSDAILTVENLQGAPNTMLNIGAIKSYFTAVVETCSELGIDAHNSAIMAAVLRFPEALNAGIEEETSPEETEAIMKCCEAALETFNEFRIKEGAVLMEDIMARIKLIEKGLENIEPFEQGRLEILKTRISTELENLKLKEGFDQNRFEQELIYYLEKMDITEEKVRLKQHCKYFAQTVESEENPGRKLGFIVQEIGREINTIGSKAGQADIQKLVVGMKDELEKIKEQLLNIL
jgi:uncharacterized protein (TIGR00255 family)